VSRNLDPLQSGVVSVTMAEAGEAQNQVPSRATLRGTARWLDEAVGRMLEARMREIGQGIAAAYGLEVGGRVRARRARHRQPSGRARPGRRGGGRGHGDPRTSCQP
jgi:hippurate hydrolase